jgi:hypothetical protein
MSGFSKWDRDAYRSRVGEEEAARRRGAIMAEQWGYQPSGLPHTGNAASAQPITNIWK